MAEYKYLLGNFGQAGTAEEIMCELPLYNVSWSESLNAPGAFTGSLLLDDPKATPENIKPGARTLYVVRDGKIEWGGILWRARTGAIDSARTIELQCEGFWSMLRRIHLNHNMDFFCKPHMQVAYELANMAKLYADCREAPSNSHDWWCIQPGSGFNFGDATVTKNYKGEELNNFGQMIEDLAARNGIYGDTTQNSKDAGFDFYFNVEWESQGVAGANGIFHGLYWGFPRKGIEKPVVLRQNPLMENFEFSIDAYPMANVVHVAGGGSGDGRPVGTYINAGSFPEYRYMSTAFTSSDTESQWVCDVLAITSGQALGGPIVQPSITMLLNSSNEETFMDLTVGDTIKIQINDGIMQTSGEGQPFRIRELSYALDDGGVMRITFQFFTRSDKERALNLGELGYGE